MFSSPQNGGGLFLPACVLALLLSFPSGKWISRYLRTCASVAGSLWRWLAKWKIVEVVFTAGWGLMLGAHEYSLSLLFLGLAAIGAFSTISHWEAAGNGRKIIACIGILMGFGLMTLVTLANRGGQQWSQIPGFLASQVPLPPSPSSISKVDTAPEVVHTPTTVLREAQESLGKFIKARHPKLIPNDNSRFEASLWPAATIKEWPVREQSLPVVNGVVTVHFTIQVRNHMAKNTRLWLRLCKGCQYAKEPIGFINFEPPGGDSEAHERVLNIGDFLPNIAYAPIIAVDVIPPTGQQAFWVGVNVGCENCDPMDDTTRQSFHINITK